MKEILSKLPDSPGIYLFYNSSKELIYVGKATSLKSRVKSYYNSSTIKSSRPIEQMIHEVRNVKWKSTDSVLEAVILESLYIKKIQPKYNVLGKDNKSWNYIVIGTEDYPRVFTKRARELEQVAEGELKNNYKYIFGPYPGLNSRATMKILDRLFHISHCRPGQGRPCLYYEMGECLGVCLGLISSREYKEKVIKPLILLLQGEKKRLLGRIKKSMERAAREENFEDAALYRNQLFSLERIHDIAMLNESFFGETMNVSPIAFETRSGLASPELMPVRIEGYDISNLGPSGIVGSMVVFTYGESDKKQYRKFKIKTVSGQSDVDSLAEMLTRRLNHQEWSLPQIFLIDGGKPQLNKARKILDDYGVNLPIVGIAKGPERKRNDFFVAFEDGAGEKFKSLVKWVNENKNLLIRVRDEAHRFAITYQRSTRRIY